MRKLFKWSRRVIISILSLDAFVWIADWGGRWDWLHSHPFWESIIKSPAFPLICLVLCFVIISAEKSRKSASIKGLFMNSRAIPNMRTVTNAAFFESAKNPGKGEHQLSWYYFVDIHIVNDSENVVTIEDAKVEAFVKDKSKWQKRKVPSQHVRDVSKFRIDNGLNSVAEMREYEGVRYEEIKSLLQTIRGVPLTKGVGYRGWLRLDVKQVSEKEANEGRVGLRVWLIDAMQMKHEVHFNKKMELDGSFLIFENDIN
jgi:hypothetical protein